MSKLDAVKGKGPKGGKNEKTVNSNKSIKTQVDTLKEKGNQHFKNEEFSRAVQLYREGLQLDPTNVALNCNLSQAYLAQGEFLEAEVHAVVTLAQQADSVKGFYRAAKAAAGMKRKDRALYYLQKGLVKCPKAEELKHLHEEISNSKEGSGFDEKKASGKLKPSDMVKPVNSSDAPEKKHNSNNQNKKRSRSVGGSGAEKTTGDIRSTSISRMTNEDNNPKENSETSIATESGQKDHFLDILTQVKNDLPADKKPPQVLAREVLRGKKEMLQSLMREGSEAFRNSLARHASEKYMTALELMTEVNIELFGMSEIDRIVLKYSLSITWIETLNYGNIVQSIGCLTDIETNHAAKLPAVYYGLGHAFFQLNRRKIALKHLEKGLMVIQKGLRVAAHPWPGTMITIQETTKEGLKESLYKLINNCKIYQEPDAMCRYKLCLTVSTHISPSESIFYSDPDYVGYVVIICQEHCKIIYHIGCWKDYKEKQSSVKKLSDKDMLGQPCLTSDCTTENNEHSVIIRIEIFGDDGNMKSQCSRDPAKPDRTKKEKKKKSDKIEKPPKEKTRMVPRRLKRETSESSNGVKKEKKEYTLSQDVKNYLFVLEDFRKDHWTQKSVWDPRKDYFGQESVSSLKTFRTRDVSESVNLSKRKDFIFTYFYEFMNSQGAQKITFIEQKWKDEVSQFPGVEEFMSPADGICDFLLQSLRFAAIDDYLCLSHQLSSVYELTKVEVGESTLFIVSYNNKLPHPADIVDSGVETNGLNKNTNHLPSPDIQKNDSMAVCFSDSEDDLEYEIDGESDDEDYEDDDESLNEGCPSSNGHYVNAYPQMLCLEIDGEPIPSTSSAVPINQVYQMKPAESKEYILSDNDASSHPTNSNTANPITEQKAMIDKKIQTEGTDYQKENEALKEDFEKLKQNEQTYKYLNRNLIKEVEAANAFKKELESKINSMKNAHEKELLTLHAESLKKDGKIESFKKKHQDLIEKFQKRIDEETTKTHNGLDVINNYAQKIESLQISNKRLEDQLKKSSEENLNTRKFFGEYMLDAYLAKCKEKLECLDPILIYLQGSTSPAFLTLKINLTRCHKEWKDIENRLNETKALLEVQFDILSQQLGNSNVSAESLLQLEFPELPREPAHFHLYMEEFILKGLQQVEAGTKDTKNVGSAVLPTLNGPNVIPGQPAPSTSRPPSAGSFQRPFAQGQDLFMVQPTQGFQPPYYYSQYFPSTPYRGGSSPANGALNNIGLAPGSRFPTPRAVSPTMPAVDKNFPLLKAASTEHLVKPIGPPQKAQDPGTQKGLIVSKGNVLNKSTESLPSGDMSGKGAGREQRNEGKVSGLTPLEFTWKPSTAQEAQSTKSLSAEAKPASIRWNYQMLLEELQKHFPDKDEVELSECLVFVREKNGNKLSGLSVPTIIRRVEKILEEKSSKKVGNMGMDKFGTAWGEVKSTDVNWHKEEPEEECIICHVHMDHNRTTLHCRHTFHTMCIRKWLHIHSTCPICRTYTNLEDEFPPLTK